MQITIYSRASCGPCKQLKQFMKLKKLSYVEKSVDNPDYAAEAYAYTGQSTVPVTLIEEADTRHIIPGYSLSKLVPILNSYA